MINPELKWPIIALCAGLLGVLGGILANYGFTAYTYILLFIGSIIFIISFMKIIKYKRSSEYQDSLHKKNTSKQPWE